MSLDFPELIPGLLAALKHELEAGTEPVIRPNVMLRALVEGLGLRLERERELDRGPYRVRVVTRLGE